MKRIAALILTLVTVLSLTACGGGTPADQTNTGSGTAAPAASGNPGAISIKYSTVFPATGVQADGAMRLGELISEESEGRMSMSFHAASTLGDKIATMEGLQMGTIEMTECAATDLSSYNSMWSVFSLPYLWASDDQAVQVCNDPAVKELLEADMEANGFKIIAWTGIGSRSVLNTTRPVNVPADLNGLKIRCMEDPILAGSINAMGASATPLAFSECYTALQQHTIDGLEHTAASILDNGMDEVAKYYSLTEQFIIPDPVFVSKVWFDRLSAEDQEALVEAGKKFEQEWNETIWPEAEAAGMTNLAEAGVAINEVDKDAFIAAVQPVIDDFLANADENQKTLYNTIMQVRDNY